MFVFVTPRDQQILGGCFLTVTQLTPSSTSRVTVVRSLPQLPGKVT